MEANLLQLPLTATAVKGQSLKKRRKRGSATFEWTLLILALMICCLGIFESYTQSRMPEFSLLGLFHSMGLFRSIELEYSPGSGIWLLCGWTGSSMMVVMMFYSIRKRARSLQKTGSLRHWLSAHMFLGIMGPLLITFHSTFKFNGIIATSFWCMLTTMLFGILGRYIYVQIPRSISGAELEVKEIESIVDEIDSKLKAYLKDTSPSSLLSEVSANVARSKDDHPLVALFFMVKTDLINRLKIIRLKRTLKQRYRLKRKPTREIIFYLKKRAALISRKNFLHTSHRLLHYWHVLHVPLSVVMFLIMFLHIAVYFVFRPGI